LRRWAWCNDITGITCVYCFWRLHGLFFHPSNFSEEIDSRVIYFKKYAPLSLSTPGRGKNIGYCHWEEEKVNFETRKCPNGWRNKHRWAPYSLKR
jgi:hypothetical protein